ncbi:MAG TPA: hypothetical protein VGM82_04710 [Gemmatimonadaceae bacterium]|jgi:hypothetical protein
MTDREAVLVLVKDDRRRERVRDELARLNVNGYAVRASDATISIFTMRPIAAVLDEAHAAVAPDDFMEMTHLRGVELLTLADGTSDDAESAALHKLVAMRSVASDRSIGA